MQCYIAANCIDILASMSDCSVDCILTDPPYGVGENYRTHEDTAELLEAISIGLHAALFAHCKKSDSHAWGKKYVALSAPKSHRIFLYPSATGCNSRGFSCWQANFVLRKRPVSPNAQRFSTRQLLEYRKSREKRSSLPEANRAMELVAQSLLVCWRENPRSIYGKRNDWRSMCRQ